MAERERRMTRPYGGVFVARTQVMDAADIHRALRRMAHEVIEHNHGHEEIVLVGLQTGGVELAHALAMVIEEIEELEFLCKPPVLLDQKITEITGITNLMLENEPPVGMFLPTLKALLAKADAVVAHNLIFDYEIISTEFMSL